MNFTREELERSFNIHKLKEICIKLGGTPGTKKKDQIIQLILDIQDGFEPQKKSAGRKSNYEKSIEYKNDEFQPTNFSDVEEMDDGVRLTVGETINVSGTYERAENSDHGFLHGENFKMSSSSDVYVKGQSARYFRLREGDFVEGTAVYGRDNGAPSLKTVEKINGKPCSNEIRRRFNDLEPYYPDKKIDLEVEGENDISLRAINLLAPIGLGQRGLIVAPPKAGKTTLIKKIASAISKNYKDVKLIILLIGERPEEVTDMKRSVSAEIIYSTFDEKPKNHVRICNLAVEKAKRMVESGEDVVILLDSITRLTRAYNETVTSSGKTLTGGIDPTALQEAKRIFGSARNVDGGSLTIIATALVQTGSKMDDVIYEEFKGTGNSEIVLKGSLSERRIFPSIDLYRSGTRKDELLLSGNELDFVYALRRYLDKKDDAELSLIEIFKKTQSNADFIDNAEVKDLL